MAVAVAVPRCGVAEVAASCYNTNLDAKESNLDNESDKEPLEDKEDEPLIDFKAFAR